MRLPILYRDAQIVVVDKPAGLPTHAPDPADPYPGDALRIVQRQLGLPYLGMHQRLDAETSGVLLFSAQPDANRALAAVFEERQAHKTYLALTQGNVPRAEGVVDAPIVRAHDGCYQVAGPGDRRAQTARTRYRVIARIPGPPALTILEVTPETGRSHQIRVHMAHIGAPVVGDPLYAPREAAAPRLGLHAHSLTLPHPATGEIMTFTAPPPALIAAFLPDHAGDSTVPAGLRLMRRAAHIRESDPTAPGLRALLDWAIARRVPLAADPETTIFRVFHAAADGLQGLTADRYGDALVVSLYDTETTLPPRPMPPALTEALLEATGMTSVYVKYRPAQASRLDEATLAQLAPPQPVAGTVQETVLAHEDGLAYLMRPGDGLNVGLFPDMREGRGRVRAWAAGQSVLNCFAYTCGFGVAATAGGARRVLNLDLSKGVLAWGQENYRANGFVPDPHDFVFGDVFDWLERLARRNERFGLVVLDPPGYSTTRARRFSAARDYGALAALAARVAEPDGLLLACTNVAEWPWRSFRDRVLQGITGAGRAATVAGVYHEPALDFPTAPGAAPYLKMLLCRLA